MELTVLGCSGSFGAPGGGACSGYLLRSGDTSIWIDCGNGTFGHLQEHVAVEDLTAVVLTHGHPDHCVDIYGLHVLLRYGIEREDVPVFAPEGLEQLPAVARQRLRATSSTGARSATATPRRSATSRCASRARITRRPRTRWKRVRRRQAHDLHRRHRTRVDGRARSTPVPTSCSRRRRTSTRNRPAPIHLSAKQAGEAAREAQRAAPDPHAPLAVERSRRRAPEGAEAFGGPVTLATPGLVVGI